LIEKCDKVERQNWCFAEKRFFSRPLRRENKSGFLVEEKRIVLQGAGFSSSRQIGIVLGRGQGFSVFFLCLLVSSSIVLSFVRNL
jgi:hypothetical protein